jgi:hypothetical protein
MIVITSNISGITVGDTAGLTTKRIPYAEAATVFARRTFDLITRG